MSLTEKIGEFEEESKRTQKNKKKRVSLGPTEGKIVKVSGATTAT